MNDTPSTRLLQYIGYLSFILIGWDTVLIPSLIRSIEIDFHQSDAAFGLLYFLRAVIYAPAALAGGVLMERISRHLVLPAAALIAALGLMSGAIVPWWAVFVLTAMVASSGHSVIDAGINAVFIDLFRTTRGSSLNLLHVFFSVGALIAPIPIGLLVTLGLGWRVLFVLTAAGFAVLSVALLFAKLPDRPRHPEPVAQDGAVDPRERSLLPFLGLACAIACYAGGELGASNWLVRYLSSQPLVVATGALSTFWLGLSLGRLLSGWVAERWDYSTFTVACVLLSSLALAGGVLVPWLGVAFVLYGISGLFSGPVYPMIMAIGGAIYPHRSATLAGALTTAGAVGTIIYPPLMGLMATGIGLQAAMLGAALLGVPAALGIFLTRFALSGRRS